MAPICRSIRCRLPAIFRSAACPAPRAPHRMRMRAPAAGAVGPRRNAESTPSARD